MIQTLTVDRKKFAVLPIRDYQKLLQQIEDLKDLKDLKKRAKEPRVSFEEVKKKFLTKNR